MHDLAHEFERHALTRKHSICALEEDGVRYQVAGDFLPALQQIRQELEQVRASSLLRKQLTLDRSPVVLVRNHLCTGSARHVAAWRRASVLCVSSCAPSIKQTS